MLGMVATCSLPPLHLSFLIYSVMSINPKPVFLNFPPSHLPGLC